MIRRLKIILGAEDSTCVFGEEKSDNIWKGGVEEEVWFEISRPVGAAYDRCSNEKPKDRGSWFGCARLWRQLLSSALSGGSGFVVLHAARLLPISTCCGSAVVGARGMLRAAQLTIIFMLL